MIEIRMILVDYSKENISDLAFEIPKLKPAEKEYSDMIMETTGNKVMLRTTCIAYCDLIS
ncbi:MAG: hypothetical protein HRT67_09530 [Flavobacteriaceae bacterium]|nr:hypothetical protein [Flavobacteriaceae bacterium]